jgi:two-component SAPR family response regulator
MFDIDLWTMRTAAAEAAAAIDLTTRITALRHAVRAYTGPLATGTDYPWIKAYRDTVRREYIAAVTALADTLTDKPDEARATLALAVCHHPDDEDLAAALRRQSASA